MDISIHAPTRGATIDWVSNPLCNAISIHAPTRGATQKDRLKGGKNEFQSTLPRGERRAELQALETVQAISIHAPTRGATGRTCKDGNTVDISIHAPTRGATLASVMDISYSINFNPRSHEGSDNINREMPEYTFEFQSTLPRGERRRKSQAVLQSHKFQSTLPRGERRYQALELRYKYQNFNPRSHEGSDTCHPVLLL